MTNSNKTLDEAYALKTPEDNKRLYADWASDYESDFVAAGDYALPQHVVAGFLGNGVSANILDIGAGTGIVGALLSEADCTAIDGIDISPEMLAEAESKGCYRDLFEADLTKPLSQIDDETYDGLLSAGTFTNGHVGPDAFDELLRIAKRGALFAISINAKHWQSKSFDRKLAELDPQISDLSLTDVQVYGQNATGPHKDDICHLVKFLKR